MRALAIFALCAVLVTVSCRAKGSGSSDTLATTSESTSTTGTVIVPATTVATPTNRVNTRTPGRVSQPTRRNADQVRADSAAKTDSGIIGRDSIIRFPIRRLPTASSTQK